VLGAAAPDAETHGSQRIEDATVTVIDLDNVRAAGVKPTATRAVDRLSRPGLAAFWIHLDADVLADAIMPAVDYRMPDGLLWEAIAEVLRAAVGSGHAAGVDVTIFNPTLDGDGSIARALANTLVRGLVHDAA